MEYTDKQIEEAVKTVHDKYCVTGAPADAPLFKFIMRMVREELRLSILDHVTKKHSVVLLGDSPALPEFWKEPKKPATESPWRPIATAPLNAEWIVVFNKYGNWYKAQKDSSGAFVTPTGLVVDEPTYWMPIPELPK